MRDEFDEVETIDRNPKSWVAWKREAERLQGIIDGMALAAMDSEPVAYTDEEELNFVNDMACMWTKGMGINEVPLYRHAQPAPVVPEVINKLLAILDRHTVQLGWGEKPITLAELVITRDGSDELEACRAAMLAAAPQEVNHG